MLQNKVQNVFNYVKVKVPNKKITQVKGNESSYGKAS